MMKTASACLIVLALLAADACTPAVAEEPAAWMVDGRSGKTLLSSSDIVRFDWDKQLFELKREKAMDLMALQVALDRPFEWRDSQGTIYKGTFVTSISSKGYDMPAIRMDSFETEPRPPLYRIDRSYPRGDYINDVRFDPRLKDALGKAGVLKAIADPSSVKPITIDIFEVELAPRPETVRVLVTVFPETFRIGQRGRIHLKFDRPAGWKPGFTHLAVKATIRSGDHLFRQQLLYVPAAKLDAKDFTALGKTEGTHPELGRTCVTYFETWKSETGEKMKPGPATITLAVNGSVTVERDINVLQ